MDTFEPATITTKGRFGAMSTLDKTSNSAINKGPATATGAKTLPFKTIKAALAVAGKGDILELSGVSGGGGGSGRGSGGGGGGLIYMNSIIFNANTTYKIRIGAGGLGMQSATDITTINGTSSILYDNTGNMLLTAVGGARGNGQYNSLSDQNKIITSNKF